MSQNPFEIRHELIKIAHEHFQRAYEINTEYFKNTVENMFGTGKKTKEQLDSIKELMPKEFTSEDVIKRATEMYDFVQNKKGSK